MADSPEQLMHLEFQAISNRNSSPATAAKPPAAASWFEENVAAPAGWPYMKLKKWLLAKGLNKEDVNRCSGKNSLLHLWKTSAQHAKEAASAEQASAEQAAAEQTSSAAPKKTAPEEEATESQIIRLSVEDIDNSDMFSEEPSPQSLQTRLDGDLFRVKAALPSVQEEQEMSLRDSLRGSGSFSRQKQRARQRAGSPLKGRRDVSLMSCPAQVGGIDPRIQKLRAHRDTAWRPNTRSSRLPDMSSNPEGGTLFRRTQLAKINKHMAQCTTGVAGESLFRRQKVRTRLLHGRALLLGDPGAGKTSLMHRWIFPERYRLSSQEAGSTKKWSLNSHTVYDEGHFETEVIDMPGATHLEYGRVRQLTGAHALLVCFNSQEATGIARVLQNTIPELVRNWPQRKLFPPVMLVACQADEAHQQCHHTRSCTEVLAELLGAPLWVNTSALTGQGCPEGLSRLMEMVRAQVDPAAAKSCSWRFSRMQLSCAFKLITAEAVPATRASVKRAILSSRPVCAGLGLPMPHEIRRGSRNAANYKFLSHSIGCMHELEPAQFGEQVSFELFCSWLKAVEEFNAAVLVQCMWRGYRVRHGMHVEPAVGSEHTCNHLHFDGGVFEGLLGNGDQITALADLRVLRALQKLGELQHRANFVQHVRHAIAMLEGPEQSIQEGTSELLPHMLPVAVQKELHQRTEQLQQAIERADIQVVLEITTELSEAGLGSQLSAEHLKLAHKAIGTGSSQILEAVLVARADVNSFDAVSHCTPLLRAAALENVGIGTSLCKLLVQHEADVTCFDQDGNTALHIGCISGNHEVVNLVLGVNPGLYGIQNGQDRNPLEEAVINQRKRVVQQLVSAGFASAGGVMKAAIKFCPHSTAMLQLSHELGANLDSFGSLHDSPPLVEATNLQNTGAIQYLLQAGSNVNQSQLSTNLSALHRAALTVDMPTAALLLEHKADVHATFQYSSWSGLTALDCVFGLTYREWSQFKYVRQEQGLGLLTLLLGAGADMQTRDSEGLTILHRGALLGDPQMLAELLTHTQVCQQLLSACTTHRKATPLHYAAISGSAACCKLLLEQGADHEALDAMKRSPLFYAAQSHDEETFFALLETGADYQRVDSKGGNLVHAVCRGVMMQGKQLHNVRKERLQQVGRLLEALEAVELSITLVDQRGASPLHMAAKYLNECALCWLLEQPAYAADSGLVSAKDDYGRTPYHWSFWQTLTEDFQDMNELLEDAGAREAELECSQVLCEYSLQTVLGAGAFGAVILGQNKKTLQPVAVKFQNAKQIVSDPPQICKLAHGKRMLIDEINIQQQAAHPFVVRIIDFFEKKSFVTQCQELQSHDLCSDIQATVTPTEVQSQMAMALCGLRHIHKLGIVHADLKEDNLLVGHNGHVRLADFGTAQRFRPGELVHSKMGTPIYFSPERVMNKGFGPPADCFAMGVIYYRLLCGDHPYLLIDSTWNDFEQFVQKKGGFGHLDSEVRNTIRKLLHADVECRWTAAQALKGPAHAAALAQNETLRIESQ